MIKILFLAASPADMPRLSLDEESRAISQALRQTKFRDQFVVEQAWAVQFTDLQELLLQHKPDVVHFSGHGSPANEIILQDENGQSRPLSPPVLTKLFALLKENLRCVVLNACYSEEQAKAISQVIDCVIGMSAAIGDKAAIRFASTFYQALGYGKDVQTAFALGCLQLDMAKLAEQDTPRLFADQQRADQLVFVTDAPQPLEPAPAPKAVAGRWRLRLPVAVWVALIGLIGTLGAALIAILPELINPSATPTPAPASPVVATLPATPPGSAVTPSAASNPIEPTLPEFAPVLTTTVAATMQPGCEHWQTPLLNSVQNSVTPSNDQPPLRVTTISPVRDELAAHQQGLTQGADLVLWGECSQEQLTQVHFVFVAPRGAPEIFEPAALVVPKGSDAQLARIINALTTYVRRDYGAASSSFQLLATGATTAEQKAWWRLLQGNSYLFRRQYTAAVDAYTAAAQAQPGWPGAYHNLGVAHMNAAWNSYQFEPALAAFTQTLQLDPAFALTYAVRGQLWLWLASAEGTTTLLDQAAAACEQGIATGSLNSGALALAQVCLAQVAISRYRSGTEQAAVDLNELVVADLATPYWSAPVITQGLLHYFLWRNTQSLFDQEQAESWLAQAIQAGRDDVFLESGQDSYRSLPALLHSLQAAPHK